ncbi:hypothetical protein P691DRAFT_775626 [Macrolepiota fuliginosa MF-IS2]|uniref:DUF6533 domain-containing protein n=1 Tax=Macrolepiota fuliginosa MF-IS2 TaxID=1400762 RepID=A0A9P5XBU7_9AGAR|nr:hypothetical protein P691DRAFT_775626 [Macrolepiota fuliginosa MF-IS2]
MASPIKEQMIQMGIVQARRVNYTMLSSVTIMIFDWMLTFNMETSLIWKSKWNTTKVLYLITRYLPFITLPVLLYHEFPGVALSKSACKQLHDYGAYAFVVGACFSEMLLTIRTWAIWGKGRGLTYALFGTFTLMWIAVFILMGFYIKFSKHDVSPAPQLVGCVLLSAGLYLALCFVLLVLYDAVTLVLMMMRGMSAFRSGRNSELFRVVYRDGIIYYVYLFGLSLLNIIVIFKLPRKYVTLLVTITGIVHSVLACRVILHIREQAYNQKKSSVRIENGENVELALRRGLFEPRASV